MTSLPLAEPLYKKMYFVIRQKLRVLPIKSSFRIDVAKIDKKYDFVAASLPAQLARFHTLRQK